jgi:hypothetical protein
MTHLHY